MSDALALPATRRKRPWHWREKLTLARIISNAGYVVFFMVSFTIGDVNIFNKVIFLTVSAMLVYVLRFAIPVLIESRQGDSTLPAQLYAYAQPRLETPILQAVVAFVLVSGLGRHTSAADIPFAVFITVYGICEYYFWWRYRSE